MAEYDATQASGPVTGDEPSISFAPTSSGIGGTVRDRADGLSTMFPTTCNKLTIRILVRDRRIDSDEPYPATEQPEFEGSGTVLVDGHTSGLTLPPPSNVEPVVENHSVSSRPHATTSRQSSEKGSSTQVRANELTVMGRKQPLLRICEQWAWEILAWIISFSSLIG